MPEQDPHEADATSGGGERDARAARGASGEPPRRPDGHAGVVEVGADQVSVTTLGAAASAAPTARTASRGASAPNAIASRRTAASGHRRKRNAPHVSRESTTGAATATAVSGTRVSGSRRNGAAAVARTSTTAGASHSSAGGEARRWIGDRRAAGRGTRCSARGRSRRTPTQAEIRERRAEREPTVAAHQADDDPCSRNGEGDPPPVDGRYGYGGKPARRERDEAAVWWPQSSPRARPRD